MASESVEQDASRHCFCMINDIPHEFHSADLRNFFSPFISDKKFDCFHFRHRPQLSRSDVVTSEEDNSVSNDLKVPPQPGHLCALVRFSDVELRDEFIRTYNNKFWIDKDGNDLNIRCRVSRVKLKQEDLHKFSKELNPPKFMPHGNVGTPNSHFLDLIKCCRLPPSMIKKLGLEFPSGRRFRKYSKVPFDYGTSIVPALNEDDNQVSTGNGVEITTELGRLNRGRLQKIRPGINAKEDKASSSNELDAEDDDRCEEWERHEAFEDDPTRQARLKERLYEEEIELVWEKGGPGIVWYTDAQFWDSQRGGFDERTSDELDVDMQGYYEGGDPDKDAQDFMDMRRSIRFRNGLESSSVFKVPSEPPKKQFKKIYLPGRAENLGTSSAFDIGFGTELMKKQGWMCGKGIGKRADGITEPISAEGQDPRDKRGFGYYGEQLTFGKKPKKSDENVDDEHRVSIGTVYDNPAELEVEESLKRRTSISYVKRYPGGQRVPHKL